VQDAELRAAVERYRIFISACESPDGGGYALIPGDTPSAFASCFALFGLWLIGAHEEIARRRQSYATRLIGNLESYRQARASLVSLGTDKPYLQLLTFTLSAAHILSEDCQEAIARHVLEVLPRNVAAELKAVGALDGQPRSGNTAMFWAILLIHARDYLRANVETALDDWVRAHLQTMNRNGFWGPDKSMTHLKFQNGYHQYEILEYLGVHSPQSERAHAAVASLADTEGHFALYPGGGGCYDYDAIYSRGTYHRLVQRMSYLGGADQGLALIGQHEAHALGVGHFQQYANGARTFNQQMAAANQIQLKS